MYGEIPLVPSMVQRDPTLWHDYFIYTGDHMILTDEGWEPEESLQSYMEGLRDGEDIRDIVLTEINWGKGNKKYPRIFPRKKVQP
jgi:hypothetical protein